MPPPPHLLRLNQRIIGCDACPRLRRHCLDTARKKTARFRDQTYWARPVPNLPPTGPVRLLIVGLAPAAHGANRTGRMFTGDRSGDFLFHALHETGFATQPHATARDDGLRLTHAAITAAVHCAPPANKPTPDELHRCRPFLADTLAAVRPTLRAVVTLGRLGHDALLRVYQDQGWIRARAAHPFAHAALHRFDHPHAPPVLCSYHPSQQNTFTGRLTMPMLIDVFTHARRLIDTPDDPGRGPAVRSPSPLGRGSG